MLKGGVDIGLIPDTIYSIIKINVVDYLLFREILLVVMGKLYICPRTATLPPKEEIVWLMVKEMEVGLKRLNNFPC